MFSRRSLVHYPRYIRALNHWLSGLAYRTKWMIVVLLLALLSTTQLPEIFAQQVTTQVTAVSKRVKKQRVINLSGSSSGSITTGSTILSGEIIKQKKLQFNTGSLFTGIKIAYTGSGQCIWDMAHMQRTGLQIYTGEIDYSQWTGVWSGFDMRKMILTTSSGVLMYKPFIMSGNYLMMSGCSRSGGQITYPGEQEYLSGLVLFSGELLELPLVFSGVRLIDHQILAIDIGTVTGMIGSIQKDQDVGVVVSEKQQLGGSSSQIHEQGRVQERNHVVQSSQEFKSIIDQGAGLMQYQKIKRARDIGKPNKLEIANTISYESNIIRAEISSGTVIFTAQGQELQVDNFVLQQTDLTPSYKKSDQVSLYTKDIIELGVSGDHLIFTKPIMITYQSDLPDGSPVLLQVQHAGQDWSTQGLSLDPNTQCDIEGSASLPGSKTSVQGGQITFYTCGASTFSLIYTGGASAPNFVDNGTRNFTGVVITGVNFPTGSVIADANILIDFRPIDNESPTGPWGATNCYPNEKSFQLIHPDGTTINLANAGTYTTPNTTCPQAQILYDQQAAGPIVSGIWNLTGQSRQPVGNLSTLNGKSPFGTWTLRMGDNAGQDGVILYGFNVQLRNIECGDGLIETGEVCDDSNAANGDGCSLSCQVEAGRQCSGQPSSCSLIPAPSGLRFHLDGSMTGALFRDIAGSSFDATAFNGVTTGNQNGETVMCFNGTNQYLERATNFVTAYPFTMSTWVRANTVTGLKGIVSYARSTATNIMYNIELNAATRRLRAQNTTARYANGTTPAVANDWFLVTTVYNSNTSHQTYVNGVLQGTNTTSVTYDTNTTKRINIGRLADSSPTNYFAGCVDDVRFYTTALNSGQVYSLYAKPAGLTTSLVTVGSPLITGTIQGTLDTIRLTISGTNYTGTNHGNGTWSLSSGTISPALVNGTYVTTMLVTNPYGRAVTYTGSFVVSIPPAPTGTICIESPDTLSMTGTQGTSGGIWETQFDYFQVQDTKGINSGYYTTLSMTSLGGPGGSTIGSGLVEWRGDAIVTLSGSANPRVVVGSTMSGSYTPANAITTFIKRDTAANSNTIGEYGSKLRLRVSIPPYQSIGLYTGIITYTLYEN